MGAAGEGAAYGEGRKDQKRAGGLGRESDFSTTTGTGSRATTRKFLAPVCWVGGGGGKLPC